jgi:hypothetical protein
MAGAERRGCGRVEDAQRCDERPERSSAQAPEPESERGRGEHAGERPGLVEDETVRAGEPLDEDERRAREQREAAHQRLQRDRPADVPAHERVERRAGVGRIVAERGPAQHGDHARQGREQQPTRSREPAHTHEYRAGDAGA